MNTRYSCGYVALTTVIVLSFVMSVVVLGMSKGSVYFQEFTHHQDIGVRSRVALLSCVSIVREKIAEDGIGLVISSPVFLPNGYECFVEVMQTQPVLQVRIETHNRVAVVSFDSIHAAVLSIVYDLL